MRNLYAWAVQPSGLGGVRFTRTLKNPSRTSFGEVFCAGCVYSCVGWPLAVKGEQLFSYFFIFQLSECADISRAHRGGSNLIKIGIRPGIPLPLFSSSFRLPLPSFPFSAGHGAPTLISAHANSCRTVMLAVWGHSRSYPLMASRTVP